MKRFLVVLALLIGLAPPPQAAADRASGKPRETYTIVLVLWRGETRVEAGLRKYISDRRLPFKLVVRDIDRDMSKLPDVRREIKRMKPDLVYSWGTPITLGLVGAFNSADPETHITQIPVVFVMVSYPVGSRIVPAFESSRRNVTGSTSTVPLESQIKAMRAYRPVHRLAIIYNALESNAVVNVQHFKELSVRLNFELLDRRVPLDGQGRPDASAIPRLISELAVREPQFLYLGQDNFVSQHIDKITEEAMRYGVPTFTSDEYEMSKGGALIGLFARYRGLGHLAGFMIERILIRDVRPRDIPIQRLSRFTYGVRMSLARKLGIYPPMNVLDYAYIIDEPGK